MTETKTFALAFLMVCITLFGVCVNFNLSVAKPDLIYCFNMSLSLNILYLNLSILSLSHCLIQFKVVYRAHVSKTKLPHMYPEVSSYCDKCKVIEASFIPMYWLCPSLHGFWTEVFHTLSLILNLYLEPDPMFALFGITGGVSFCFPSGLESHSVKMERHCPAHSFSVASRHCVLPKTRKN